MATDFIDPIDLYFKIFLFGDQNSTLFFLKYVTNTEMFAMCLEETKALQINRQEQETMK